MDGTIIAAELKPDHDGHEVDYITSKIAGLGLDMDFGV